MSEHESLEEIVFRLKRIQASYEEYAQKDAINQANSYAVGQINDILFQNEEITFKDVNRIIELITWTENQPHWDGASWVDFKMTVGGCLSKKGLSLHDS